MAASPYLQQKWLEATLRNVAYTPTATVYLALFHDSPLIGGTEVGGGAYARQAISFAAFASGKCLNSATITYPTPTLDWGAITWYAIMDASTSGNVLLYAPMNPIVTILNGVPFSLPASAIAALIG